MKGFFKEFREFINRGNVMDLAVAIVIGTAFTAIVNSVVADFIMPIISALTGGFQFTEMKLVIPIGAGESAITYGNLINAVVQFLVIAVVVFSIVKALNSMRKLVGVAKDENLVEDAYCEYCKEIINREATRCPHCTAELPLASASIEKGSDKKAWRKST